MAIWDRVRGLEAKIAYVKRRLFQLEAKVDLLVILVRREMISPGEHREAQVLLNLPDHIRRTYMILKQIGPATAADVAAHTHRARAVESGYLNTLVTMSLAVKDKRGRAVVFKIVA